VKALLLDQTVIAGIGNIYADEALYRAGIRPTRRVRRLSGDDRFRLAREIQAVLRESLAQQGTSANDYVDTKGERGGFLALLRVYGRGGEPCLVCGLPIHKTVVAQRGTHYCKRCQP
jgi:formamidopyrimidine-DNA glycosylase